jgi:hypothetical protein
MRKACTHAECERQRTGSGRALQRKLRTAPSPHTRWPRAVAGAYAACRRQGREARSDRLDAHALGQARSQPTDRQTIRQIIRQTDGTGPPNRQIQAGRPTQVCLKRSQPCRRDTAVCADTSGAQHTRGALTAEQVGNHSKAGRGALNSLCASQGINACKHAGMRQPTAQALNARTPALICCPAAHTNLAQPATPHTHAPPPTHTQTSQPSATAAPTRRKCRLRKPGDVTADNTLTNAAR